ncbi:MAG: hypothetical protein ACJ76X_08125 [Solirubrobacteraceae bacterium]
MTGWHPNLKRLAPTLVAAVLATVYVIVSPPSFDLAAHLLRAKLFRAEGFGLWNNWWYAGHHTLGYSVLFPPLEALTSPQLVAALAAVGTAAAFEVLARRHFGERAWLGSLWFGAATATNLYTGRLAFAFGLLPAVLAMLALQAKRPYLATTAAVATALASPVAALFAALGGAAHAIGSYITDRRLKAIVPGMATVVGAVLPVAALAIAFPEGGSEPFTFATLWPVALIAGAAFVAVPSTEPTVRAGVLLYGLGCIAAYAVESPIGSNAARLGALLAGPLAALLWFKRRPSWLLAAALPLAYVQWQAPVRDVNRSANDPSVSASYYRPLLAFLDRQAGPPFRVEIPFTKFHWETYDVAPYFPLARGWERQLDIKYNQLFYNGTLTPATYLAWLHELAVRFVGVSDARLDFSAEKETQLIDRGLPYLKLVLRTKHWRVYAVRDPTPIVSGDATLTQLSAGSLTLTARRAGAVDVRVRFTPYWTIADGSGCVQPAGDFTALQLRKPGRVHLAISFALGRIGARSPRCT